MLVGKEFLALTIQDAGQPLKVCLAFDPFRLTAQATNDNMLT